MKLKEIYDSKIFHGRLTEEEVYDLCRAELTNHGKPKVYIWFLHESDGKLQGRIYGYRPNETVPFIRHNDVQQVFLSSQNPGSHLFVVQRYNHGAFDQGVRLNLMGFQLNTIDFVERRNPIQLLELARVEFLDNCNYCCLRSLIKRIDELQLQTTEKEELKKLIRGFPLVLASKIPNEL